jgi:hypothetical protein
MGRFVLKSNIDIHKVRVLLRLSRRESHKTNLGVSCNQTCSFLHSAPRTAELAGVSREPAKNGNDSSNDFGINAVSETQWTAESVRKRMGHQELSLPMTGCGNIAVLTYEKHIQWLVC